MSAELHDWPGAGWPSAAWLVVLAFTAAIACVALLRRPCRRLFGAESAFVLWVLPPLAMLASQLPHAPIASAGMLSGAARVVASVTEAWPPAQAAGVDWIGAVAWVWLLGAAMSLVFAAVAQMRYRRGLRGAATLAGVSLPWPVLRAATSDTGPALVGAWRPRIVVPADFEARYERIEQALVLAHEAMHARRHDGWWSLLAQLFASLFWFHPMSGWALAALRRDQELACDAAVLRERRGCRRSYAQALLKTPAATQSLPVGCSWSSRHPLTERIAMLKSPSYSYARRRLGGLASLVIAGALASTVYAASTPVTPQVRGQGATAGQYQLDIQLALASDGSRVSHPQRLKVALCMAPGQVATLATHGTVLGATTRGLAHGRVSIDLAMHGETGAAPIQSRLEGVLGQPVRASGKVPGGKEQYILEITPLLGCPASATAAKAEDTPVT